MGAGSGIVVAALSEWAAGEVTIRTTILGVVLVAALGLAIWVLANGGIGVTAAPEACGSPPARETSTDYLLRTAHCLFGDAETMEDRLRLALIDDLYIKSWAYSVLNKACFWASIVLALLVLVYPALGPILTPAGPASKEGEEPPRKGWFQRAITSSAVQTSMTALAAGTFAFYAHYKERQSVAETLMRELLVQETVDEAYMRQVVQRIAQMDKGFGFATTSAAQGNP